jgi:protein-S-isoprenylcysteine O-methyltransferase
LIIFQPRLLVLLYLTLFGLYIIGETVLVLRWRAKEGHEPEDRGFRSQALLVLIASNLVAIPFLRLFPALSFGTYTTSCVGLTAMFVGLMLRWWSIIHLGRFFTVDVAIARDHRVVNSGPYRLIRHPSYAGVLLVVAGIGVCFGNLGSLLVLFVPCLVVLMRRMRVEEAALLTGMGDAYREYMVRTKRLIPGVY